MPICSYLIQADNQRLDRVLGAINDVPGCSAAVSADQRAVILVTDTPDLQAEARLQRRLRRLPGVDGLVLTFGYTEPENLEQMAATGLPEVDDEQ